MPKCGEEEGNLYYIPIPNNSQNWQYASVLGAISNEYPFFTFYLPENIKEFEDFIVIRDDGTCCEIIARSKDYFYRFQKFS